jgi:glucose-1-phosphate adenylyltransferase
VPLADASQFGVLAIDGSRRVTEFAEKPETPSPMPDDPERALVSMGNYLFSRRPLIEALLADARRSTDHDFGRSIIPEMVPTGRVYGYDFQDNEVPGIKPYEEPGYWRDVGTIDAYWDAHMDLLGESPRFDLDNRYWPIRTGQHPGPAARFIGSDVDNAQIGEASLIKRATIRNSILGRSVWVNEGAVIEDSIIMDHTTVGKGARLRRVIVDRFNIIPADTEIGLDAAADRRRFHVDASGLVVVPRGGRRDFLRNLDDL